MALTALSLAIAGIQHPNRRGPSRGFELRLCIPGEPVELRPEPGNPADPLAVAIYSARGIQLGYVTAERAPWIGAMIRNGREVQAIFQGMTRDSAFVRLAFDGETPSLPPRRDLRKVADPENDNGNVPDQFWPDDIPADEIWDEPREAGWDEGGPHD